MTPAPAPSRRGGWIALLGLAFVLAMTMTPQPRNVELVAQTPLWCVLCGSLAGLDIILNVLLFVPYGFGLRLAGWSRGRVALAAFATTLLIEITQYFFIPGRDASLGDLITNTAGGLVGMVLAERYVGLVRPEPCRAGWLAGVAATIWLLLQVVTAWSVGVSLPDHPYWGQRAPELAQFDRFLGVVTEARLADEPMPSTRLPDSRTVRERLVAGAGIAAQAVSGPPTARLAPIVSVFDETRQEIILLGQSGTDLVFRIHTRAWSLGLRGPALRLPRVLPPDSGRPFVASGRLTGGYLEASADTGAGPVSRSLALSPSWGWSLLLPFENYAFGESVRWLTALWLAGVLFPVGYWAARAQTGPTSRPRGQLLIGLLIAAGLAGAGALFRLPPVHWSEWVAAGGGAAAGWLLGQNLA